ncbi:MAG TPA: alpha/beta hydrolase [Usitatibacteraceae bacterium]|nr:alpha/beta hydrolase [Usitatibacteraceae bacterium]
MLARPLLTAAILAVSSCTPIPETGHGTMKLADCRVAGLDRIARCGSQQVWEDRASRQGRRIEIRVAVIPARRRDAEPDPIVVLAGGPGQGAIALAPQVTTLFARLNDSRDLVLVDQRGTGGSHPLDCEPEEDAGLQSLFEDALPEKMVKDCLASLDADPRHYATSTAVADLDEVLGALGYARVNLWGGSYGTRVALEFMRRHPGRVRTATLDGVAPMGMKLPLSFVADGEAAFDRLVADCESEAACRRSYPGLRGEVSGLRARLARRPARVAIVDPVTGEPQAVRVTENILLSGLFRPLYAPELASLLPLAITRASDGDFNPLLAQNLELAEDIADNLSVGMHLSVICSEDVPRITPGDLAAASRGFFGRALVDDFLRACRHWPRAQLPADFYEPVRSMAPVLILSGGIDPATPPRHGEAVAAGLPNARHAVAPHLSHGVSGHGCAPRLIEKFVRSADARSLDTTCLARIPRPLFVLPVGTLP